MRLVDADKMIEKWNELSVRGRTEFDQVIMITSTAFDVDKVVKQLEKESYYTDIETDREVVNLNEAIEIVKAGGVDENIWI